MGNLIVWPCLWATLTIGCQQPVLPAGIQSDDPDARIRAIRAAAKTGDIGAVPHIVDRLEDEDDGVRFFAILALERLTGERLGYDYAASESDRSQAAERWREYVRLKRHLADSTGKAEASRNDAAQASTTREGPGAPP